MLEARALSRALKFDSWERVCIVTTLRPIARRLPLAFPPNHHFSLSRRTGLIPPNGRCRRDRRGTVSLPAVPSRILTEAFLSESTVEKVEVIWIRDLRPGETRSMEGLRSEDGT